MSKIPYGTLIGNIIFTNTDPNSTQYLQKETVPWYSSDIGKKFSHYCRYVRFKQTFISFDCGPEAFDTKYETVLTGYKETDWVDRSKKYDYVCHDFLSDDYMTGFPQKQETVS